MADRQKALCHRGSALSLLLLTLSSSAPGLDRDRTINQFFHTAWTVRDGGPSGLTQLAQTTDGYLWLGTQTGLVRFDGVRFETYEPTNRKFPSNNVSALLPTPDGGLWVGFATAGVAFLKDGRIATYGLREGLPSSPVYAFGRDGEGTFWLGTSRGIYRFERGQWRNAGASWNAPDDRADSFLLDRQGTFWVSTAEGLFFLPPHARVFQLQHGVRSARLGQTIRSARLAEAKDGTLWAAEYRDTLRPLPASGAPFYRPSEPATEPEVRKILVDRDNSMWVLTYREGIDRIADLSGSSEIRVRSGSRIDRYTEMDGLSDNHIMAALEDREGNIWVATRGGLDRFRRRNAVPAPFPYGGGEQDLALMSGTDGTIWAGNLDQPLMSLRNGRLSFETAMQGVTSSYRDPQGILWFGGEGTLARLEHGHFQRVALPREVSPGPNWAVQALTRDRDGDLWVSILQNGVYRQHNGHWTHWGDVAALPRKTALTMWTDQQGRVWFGYTGNLAAVLDRGVLRTFSSSEGLPAGNITAFGGTGGHVWVGGQEGLAVFEGTRFRMIGTANEHEFSGVSGIIEMANGDLWLNQATGVARIPASEVAAVLRDATHHPYFELFDFRDGVVGIASPLRPLPAAILSADGRIWVTGTNGASWIDPGRIYRNPLPPPVDITSVVVDGKHYEPSARTRLPASPSNVRIEYTALSLSIPERVRFRYQLEGFDKGWQDADTRRAAFYTGLGPGNYRFHVIASNNDGVWNTAGASFGVIVPPAFYQTAWFMALCVCTGAGVLWGLYLLRLRQMAARMHGLLEERMAERERIARELHDTLLQGIQGTLLRFQAAAKHLSPTEPGRHMIEEALDRADAVMEEGRDRVRDLRVPADTLHTLSQAFVVAGEELSREYPRTAFRVVVNGTPEELHPLIVDEAYRIGREALVNAFSHAKAGEIEVELTYKRVGLQLRICDDGRGIEPKVLSLGGRPGHWGMKGMRERAQKIGGHLDIRTRPGAGTEIELRIRASAAYRGRFSGGRWRWAGRGFAEPRP